MIVYFLVMNSKRCNSAKNLVNRLGEFSTETEKVNLMWIVSTGLTVGKYLNELCMI